MIAIVASINASFDNAGCRCADHAAKVVEEFASPFTFPILPERSGPTVIAVALSSSGHVEKATVWRSSGSVGLDQDALSAARASHYAPASKHCHGVSSVFFFKQEHCCSVKLKFERLKNQ